MFIALIRAFFFHQCWIKCRKDATLTRHSWNLGLKNFFCPFSFCVYIKIDFFFHLNVHESQHLLLPYLDSLIFLLNKSMRNIAVVYFLHFKYEMFLPFLRNEMNISETSSLSRAMKIIAFLAFGMTFWLLYDRWINLDKTSQYVLICNKLFLIFFTNQMNEWSDSRGMRKYCLSRARKIYITSILSLFYECR